MATSISETNAISSVGEALNALLADMFALYLKTKGYHWHVKGPSFRDYHLLLDDQASQILGATDAIAERARKIGSETLRSIGDVGRHQRISDDDRRSLEPMQMLSTLLDDNRSLVANLRELKTLADGAADNATSSMVDDWTDEAEQRVWFLVETVGR